MFKKCKICGKIADLRTHIRTHKITAKEYYDRYLKKEGEGICPICGNETKFISIGQGYHIHCCHACQCSSEEVQDKRKKNWYLVGCGNEKRKETWKNKSIEEKREVTEKIKKTNLERYNKEYYSQTDEWKDNIPMKISQILNEKIENGEFEPFSLNIDSIKKYCKDNNIEYKGYTNIFQVPNIIEQSNKTKLEKYGNINYNNINKIIQTNLEKYGCEYTLQNHNIFKKTKKKYYFDNKTFDSKPEIEYYIWLKEHNIPFEYQPNISFEYEYNGKIRKYFPDFKVNDEIVEIKGLHFFKDGKMICPYDNSKNDLFEAKHQCMLKNNVKIITDYSIYSNYVNEKYTKDFVPLFRKDLPFPYLNENLKEKTDIGLIHHFHKSIYEANRKNKPSPLEAWNDKNLVYKCALNRLKYVGHCNPSDILQGFNVSKIAPKISVFKPKLAKEIIEKYLNEYDIIYDPFSGFSGRLLGAYNCGKKYIGKDINEKHILESKEIITYKNMQDLCQVEIEDLINAPIRQLDTNSALFTCPPYGGKEHWNKDNDEIEKTCDEWIDLCIEKYKCKKYVFVIDKTEKYKDYIVETIENKSYYGKSYEYIIVI